ncbi:hypothetical protein ACTACK_21805 [Pseudomonas syringae]|uniref:hypothetical protein n=1 Tax=Pseudomonas syringae TaxID=317 RepID=UPI003F7515B6
MNKELIKKIIDDLEKSGFSTELQARKIFQDSGWSVNAGYGYLDKDENKSREIDILATKVKSSKHQGKSFVHSEFHVCAEVKKTEKPWVVFDQQTNPALLGCAWNNLISAINLPVSPSRFAQTLQQRSPIKINGWVASGIHESFKNPDQPSRWYSSFVSVAKASEFYFENCPGGEKQTDNILENPCEIHFIQPLVILSGQLYRATLARTGEIEITETQAASFRFDYRSKNYERQNYRIDLVTLSGLETYLENLKARQIEFSKKIEDESKLDVN